MNCVANAVSRYLHAYIIHTQQSSKHSNIPQAEQVKCPGRALTSEQAGEVSLTLLKALL
jgi:hypothetical protein